VDGKPMRKIIPLGHRAKLKNYAIRNHFSRKRAIGIEFWYMKQ
jgi:hypothetical protein